MKKMKTKILVLGLVAALAGLSFSAEKKILKDELPKDQIDFYDGKKQELNIDVDIPEGTDVESLPKFLIKEIHLKDETGLISEKRKKKIISKYEFMQMNVLDIKRLVKELTNEYMKDGYVTTRVLLEPNQNLQAGILNLVTVEGRMEEVVLDKDRTRDKRRSFFAFSNETGQIFNIRDIDQGIDNLNRLDSNDAKLSIVPGDKPGYSKVIINSNQTRPFRLKLGYENTKQDREKFKAMFEYDDLFGIDDKFYLYYKGDTDNLLGHQGDKKTDDFNVGYSFPAKNWEFNLSYSYSDDSNKVKGIYSNYTLDTKTQQYSLGVNRLLYRNADVKVNVSFGIDMKSEKTYLEKTRLEGQDKDFTVANVGINGIYKLLGGMSSYGFTYYRGLKEFGAGNDGSFGVGTLDTDPLNDYDNRYQFNKYGLDLSWYRPFYFKNQGVTFSITGNGQYTDDSFFSNEKISIGSYDTVRGFSDSVSGDTGYYIRTEVSYILPSFTKSDKINDFMYKIRPFLGVDYGQVRDNYNYYGEKKGDIYTLSGYTAGIKYYGEKLNLDFGISKGDSGPDFIRKDDYRGYISGMITF